MEYEQLEVGSKIIFRCITLQDIAGFADLLSPSCLLVTHFPAPPQLSSGCTSFIEPFRYRVPRRVQLKKLLDEQAALAQRQQERYNEHFNRFSGGGSSHNNNNRGSGDGGSSGILGKNGTGLMPAAGYKSSDDGGGSLQKGKSNGEIGGAASAAAASIGLPAVLNGSRPSPQTDAGKAGGRGGVRGGGKVPSAKGGKGGDGARGKGKGRTLTPLPPPPPALPTSGSSPPSPNDRETLASAPVLPSQAAHGGRKGGKLEKDPTLLSEAGGGRGIRKGESSSPSTYNTSGGGGRGGGGGGDTPFHHCKSKQSESFSPGHPGTPSVYNNNNNNNNNNNSQQSTSRPYSSGFGNTMGGRADPLGVQLYFHSELENVPPYAPDASNYHTHLDISDTPLLVTARFYELLAWMATSKYIAEPKPLLQPRKGILQDNEVLPPPSAPRSLQERFFMLGRQYTDRNQPLSQLWITWGKETLLLQDIYYFLEGKVVTIHRRFVPLKEMVERVFPSAPTATVVQQGDMIRETLLELFGDKRTGGKVVVTSATADHSGNNNHDTSSGRHGTHENNVHANNQTSSSGGRLQIRSIFPLLDFSFVELDGGDAIRLLQVAPLSGEKHIPRGMRPEVDPRLAKGVFLTGENDPTAKRNRPQRTLIKAKSKKGDEEAYEFDTHQRLAFLEGAEGEEDAGGGRERETVERLVEVCKKHDATAVRIASCKLQERVEKLALILRGLVANAFMTIRSLDLSDNQLRHIPCLSSLPLQKLFLHGNQISDWGEVQRHVCPLPFVRFLTLHGNPIAESRDPPYWAFLLASVLGHPHRLVRLKQVDFVTLTAQDYHVAGSFELFHTGSPGILDAEKAYRKWKEGGGGQGKSKMKETDADGGTTAVEPIWEVPDKGKRGLGGGLTYGGGAAASISNSMSRLMMMMGNGGGGERAGERDTRWGGLARIAVSQPVRGVPSSAVGGAIEAGGQFSLMVGNSTASMFLKKSGGGGGSGWKK